MTSVVSATQAGISNSPLGEAEPLRAVTSPTFSPLYQQIKGLITKSLESGEWKPGELIPSEVELAARYGVSQGTVRKAIDEMAQENLVIRRQGKGTFVATHQEAKAQFRFLRLIPDDGNPVAAENKLLECRRARASVDVARMLQLKAGESVILIRRLLSFKSVPTILDEIWLPANLFKGLTAERLIEYKGPMYALFEAEFGTRLVRAEEKVRAVLADANSAQWLGVATGAPLLSVERVSMTYQDRPAEVRRGLYLTDHFYYHNELS